MFPIMMLKKDTFINKNLNPKHEEHMKTLQFFTNEECSTWVPTKSHSRNDMELMRKFLRIAKFDSKVVEEKMKRFHESKDIWYK
jgi:hypothetical protein